MKYTSAMIAAAAGTAMAAPASDSKYFDIVATRSGSPIHFASVSASDGNLYLNLPHQDAKCDKADKNEATFFTTGDELNLFSNGNAPGVQSIFIDRSGMGQGKIGYTMSGQQGSRNAEKSGWSIDESFLKFDGKESLLACPGGKDGAWTVWIDAKGDGKPAGQDGCLGFRARVNEVQDPVSCIYTLPDSNGNGNGDDGCQ